MATLKEPFALDRSLNTTELTPRNIADVLAEGLSHITGRTASEVEYDNSESGLTSDDVQGAIDELSERPTLPTTDIQTAVDEFETYNGGLLSECKVALSPNQDLHGYDSPWVGGAGKNKFEVTATTATEQGVLFNVNSDGTITTTRQSASSNNASIILGDFTLPVGSYKINGANNAGTGGYFTLRKASDNTFIANIESSGYDLNVTDATFEYRLTCVVQSAVSPTGDYTTVKPMIRLSTESDATFAPYTNICPISGHTQVDVDVSDGQTTQEQVTVNLGGTYYSGTLDVVSGVLTVDKVKAVTPTRGSLDSSGKLYTISFSGGTIHNYTDTGIVTPYVMCSHLDVDSLAGARDTQRKCICQYAGGVYIGGYVGEETALDNMLASADFSIVFELATPTSIQLSPTMVKALVGENHLDAPLEGQEITESEYRELFTWDEVESYVNAHIGGGSGMNYSTNEQVIGTWIDGKPLYQRTYDLGSEITISGSSWQALGINTSGFKIILKCSGIASDGTFQSELLAWNNSGTLYVQTPRNSTGYVLYITLQYTKTTD